MKPVGLKPPSQLLEPLHTRSLEIALKRDIGRSIAEVRIRRGLTQEDLAERLGCSVNALASLERGQVFPRFRMLAALSHQLGVPLRDLLDQVDQTEPGDERRARLELRGRALLNQLSNEYLEIAIEQLSVLDRRDCRPGQGMDDPTTRVKAFRRAPRRRLGKQLVQTQVLRVSDLPT
jgi:transcriptional regulator with XRE-family HTH domain